MAVSTAMAITVAYLIAPLVTPAVLRCAIAATLPAVTALTVMVLSSDQDERQLLLGAVRRVRMRSSRNYQVVDPLNPAIEKR